MILNEDMLRSRSVRALDLCEDHLLVPLISLLQTTAAGQSITFCVSSAWKNGSIFITGGIAAEKKDVPTNCN